MMKRMDDKELDSLFEQSAQRQKAVEQINRQVMQTVRRDMRLKVLRKWAKLLGVCFGLPTMFVLYIYMLRTSMPELAQPVLIALYVLPLGTLVALFGKALHDFSPTDM